MDWGVFISHAWEDKEAFACPLAKAQEEEGLRVWYDEFTLRVGDSLRRSILITDWPTQGTALSS
jgi:hypothetical protein